MFTPPLLSGYPLATVGWIRISMRWPFVGNVVYIITLQCICTEVYSWSFFCHVTSWKAMTFSVCIHRRMNATYCICFRLNSDARELVGNSEPILKSVHMYTYKHVHVYMCGFAVLWSIAFARFTIVLSHSPPCLFGGCSDLHHSVLTCLWTSLRTASNLSSLRLESICSSTSWASTTGDRN